MVQSVILVDRACWIDRRLGAAIQLNSEIVKSRSDQNIVHLDYQTPDYQVLEAQNPTNI